VVGDFNINLIGKLGHTSKQFVDIAKSFDLDIKIRTPTRVTQRSESCIDNVLTDLPECVAEVLMTHLSDHDAILATIVASTDLGDSNHGFEYRIINEESLSNLKQSLAGQSWDKVYISRGVENKYEIFVNMFYCHFNNSCPVRISKNNIRNNPWFTAELSVEKDKLHETYGLFRNCKCPNVWEQYKKQKKEYEKHIQTAKMHI